MSGHSHWATIKHKKGAVDAKRGVHWSKLSRAIIIAARHGGGDPNMNLKLRYAIGKAREVSMPKDNIERAIKRGTGEVEGLTFDEISYEGFGPGGAAVLVEILTDNRNRTNGEVRKLFERGGYLFERKGLFHIPAEGIDEDALLATVLDAGADDLRRMGPTFEIVCDPLAFNKVQEALQKAGLNVTNSELAQIPKTPMDVDAETAKRVVRLMEALDDHDDVQNVYSNINMTEEIIAELEKE
jgi:YebC/PmpR family DNA-binding regulatory protein